MKRYLIIQVFYDKSKHFTDHLGKNKYQYQLFFGHNFFTASYFFAFLSFITNAIILTMQTTGDMLFCQWYSCFEVSFCDLATFKKEFAIRIAACVNYSILSTFVNYVPRGHSTIQPACYRLFCVFVYNNEAIINARSTECIVMQRLVTNFLAQMLAVSCDNH